MPLHHDSPPWMAEGNCRKADPAMFFKPDTDDPEFDKGVQLEDGTYIPVAEAEEKALRECGACPFSTECLEYALDTNQTFGVWGGTTEEQRDHLRRELDLIPHGTERGYMSNKYSCRCAECLEAVRVARQDRKEPIVAKQTVEA